MTDPQRVDRPPVDSNGCLIADLSCRRCGYNLRGLREEGACPECGSAVGLSTRGNFLRFADPKWVETIAKGIRIILWGILVSIFGNCIAGGLSQASPGMAPAAPVLALLASLVGLFGAWLLTEPDPSHVGEDRTARARRITRVALLLGVVAGLLGILEQVLPNDPAMHAVFGLITIAVGLFTIVGEFYKFVYLEHLASRVPDDLLVKRARVLRWAFVICTSALVVGGVTVAVGSATQSSAFAVIGGFFAIFGGIAFLIVGIASILFYFRLSKRLKEQSELAKLTWAAGTRSN